LTSGITGTLQWDVNQQPNTDLNHLKYNNKCISSRFKLDDYFFNSLKMYSLLLLFD